MCASGWQYDRAMSADFLTSERSPGDLPSGDHPSGDGTSGARSPNPAATPGWHASLRLGWQRRGPRTVLTRREHVGPLRVQKALYPEGEEVCHVLLVHPPAGIVGGDRLALDLDLGAGSHALVTTPGATKWYGSAGPRARQDTTVRVASGACLEWLPQENIVYDSAEARQTLQVDLQPDAAFLGLDILCLGRQASGERFRSGRFGLSTRIDQGGVPLWREWGTLHGGSAFLDHPAGLRGASVSATLLAAGVRDSTALVAALRAAVPAGEWAVTALPGLVLARWLGQAGEAARLWFIALWQVLRPALCGRLATLPRIWNT